jgi:hypothetical protein
MDKATPRLNQTKFHRPGHASLTYVATPNYGETLAQVLDDAYWAHVAAELKAGYKIEVMPEGLPYYAELIVVHAEPARAVVKLLHYVDLVNEAKAPVTADIVMEVALGAKYKAERKGAWFRVLRVADQEVMKTGFRTIADAEAWAKENLKVEA